ncbi:MAG: hypothetical protein E6K70_17870 [Planctomycetota bacterium]|nr:MAG: hypothetical protein E6K70_17870 [Planctomycetota bacterium]
MQSAMEKAKENNVAGRMKEAATALKNGPQLSAAGRAQAEAAKAMEDVVKAMEERREEELDRLIKKMKEAEKKLDDLANRQERLQKKMKEAVQIADAAKRAEELKRLAREQEQLQKETQEMARELSRLRSDRASQAMNQAGGQMQRAGQQLDRGEEAEEQQEEALERLNDAQRELQQSREEAEEELAREKLTKIAEPIKALRERQQGLIEQASRIHQKVLQENRWPLALQKGLSDLAEAQDGLGRETEQIAKDRLEGTKSAEAMRQAARRMRDRVSKKDPGEDEIEEVTPEGTLDGKLAKAAGDEVDELQRTALRRLDQLLEALKPEKGLTMGGSQRQGGGGGGGGGGQQGGGKGEGDGIPPLAELKALKALQHEVSERTRAFARKHPDVSKLGAKEQEELKGIRREQQDVTGLFHDVNAPSEPEGGKP